jgi:hypothetical protein
VSNEYVSETLIAVTTDLAVDIAMKGERHESRKAIYKQRKFLFLRQKARLCK